MELKNKISEYTEDEFKKLIELIIEAEGTEEEQDNYLENFISVTGHPDGSDLIYYPSGSNDGSVLSILKLVKEWRVKNKLPLFK